MKATLKNENGHPVLVVEIPISKGPSASGKTTVVASTNGRRNGHRLGIPYRCDSGNHRINRC